MACLSMNGEELKRGDVVRCYAIPSRRKKFRHATVLRTRGTNRVRIRFDIYRELTVPADQCEGPLKNLKFRWRFGRRVPV